MGVAENERKWARRVSELENLWGCEGVRVWRVRVWGYEGVGM